MNTKTNIAILFGLLALLVALAGFTRGETPQQFRVETITTTYTDLDEDDSEAETTITLPVKVARLLSVEVRTENCADCDVIVQTATGATGGAMVYYNDALSSQTIEGTTYSQYLFATPGAGAGVPFEPVSQQVFLRIINNDAEATDDEDVTVTLVFGS